MSQLPPTPTAAGPAEPAPAALREEAAAGGAHATDATATPQQQSFLGKLKEGECDWAWKVGLRGIICTADIIGIGCVGWLVSYAVGIDSNPYIGYFVDSIFSVWALITFGVSFLWCAVVLLVLFLRRPPRPVHPGVAVGIDLILWMSCIVTGMLLVGAIYGLSGFGDDPTYLSDPSYSSHDYSGNYYLAPNNTWVYNVTYVYDYSSSTTTSDDEWAWNSTSGEWYRNETATTTPDLDAVVRDCTPAFDTCAEQDAYINRLWRDKRHRQGVTVTATVCQWLVCLLHFVLFVWACVDTHRRNSLRKGGQAQLLADIIIQDMHKRGLITVNQGPTPAAAAAATQGTQPLLAGHHQMTQTGPSLMPGSQGPSRDVSGELERPEPAHAGPSSARYA